MAMKIELFGEENGHEWAVIQGNRSSTMKVSVVTVCYNSVKTLEQTILSVLNQSYKNIEYIIIDGGSTDGTVDIIRKYADKLAYWVSEPDDGIYCAMNKGLAVATGDIVGIINSDDWYAEDAVEYAVDAFAEDTQLGFTHGDIMMISRDCDQIRVKGVTTGTDSIVSWYPHPTMFVRRSVYLKHGGFDESYQVLADGEMMLRLKRLGVRSRRIDEVVAYFRLGGVSSSYENVYKYFQEEKRLLTEMERLYAEDVQSLKVIKARKAILCKARLVQYLNMRIWRTRDVDFYRNILTNRKKEQYVLWGAGSDGLIALEYFSQNRDLIRCFVDSDVSKQGQKLGGVCIVKPNKEYLAGAYIVIMTRFYSDEIGIELERMGFVHGDDFVNYQDFMDETILATLKRWKFSGASSNRRADIQR